MLCMKWGGIYRVLGVDWRARIEFGVMGDQWIGWQGVEVRASIPFMETNLGLGLETEWISEGSRVRIKIRVC